MVGFISGNGLVPIALFIILITMNYLINLNEQKKEANNMEQDKTTIKKMTTKLFNSTLSTFWAIGASVTATNVLL